MDDKVTDEKLASEDWKCLFLITLTILICLVGYLIESKLREPIEYCTPDFCIKELKR